MEKETFKNILTQQLLKIDIKISEEQKEEFYQYMQKLLLENEKTNLTAITDENEIVVKHFVDSLTINSYIKESQRIIDVGTGAGFPGMPIAIYRKDVTVSFLDSLNKRIEFLKKVTDINSNNNTELIWGRAEDVARMPEYREMFDVAVSRAVAPMNVLVEYLLPFVKVGGICICMKGPNYQEEMINFKTVVEKLGGKVEKVDRFDVLNLNRNIVIVKKVKTTDKAYPRKAGMPRKRPLC